MKARAIFFDVDETLVYYDIDNLEEKLKEIIEGVIKQFKIGLSYEDFEKMTRLEIPRTYVKNFGVDPIEFWKKIDEGIFEFRRELARKGLIKKYPDVDVLEKIPLPMAAISNASTQATEFVLEITSIKKYFKKIQGKDYSNIDGCKPSPYLIIKVAKELSLDPRDVLVVGDSISDVIAAKRAKAIAVHVDRFGKTIREADIVIDNLYELLEVLEDLY